MAYVQVAVGVIVREGRVLLTRRRAGDRFAGLWEFPGGKLEADESAQSCIMRELDEELGIEVSIVARMAPVSHDYGDLQVTLHPFIVTLDAHEPETDAEMCWATVEQMQQLALPAASIPLVDQLPAILGRLGL